MSGGSIFNKMSLKRGTFQQKPEGFNGGAFQAEWTASAKAPRPKPAQSD